MVNVFSSVHNPPSCSVFRIRNSNGTAEGVALTPVGCLYEAKPPDVNYRYPELFSYKISSGDKLCGMIFKPHRMVEGRKYPVVLCVYGGPEVQLVTNTFKVSEKDCKGFSPEFVIFRTTEFHTKLRSEILAFKQKS